MSEFNEPKPLNFTEVESVSPEFADFGETPLLKQDLEKFLARGDITEAQKRDYEQSFEKLNLLGKSRKTMISSSLHFPKPSKDSPNSIISPTAPKRSPSPPKKT